MRGLSTLSAKILYTLLIISSVWWYVATADLYAQQIPSNGPNAVWTSSAPSPSFAFIDASTSYFVGNDICQTLNLALSFAATNFPQGAVIDARGLTSSNTNSFMTCAGSNTPWVYGASHIYTPSTVLLPDAVINISTTWVLPNGTRLVGEQTTDGTNSLVPYPTLVASNFSAADGANSMIEMGSSSSNFCPNSSACYGISVEHLTLDAAGNPINVIYNNDAQDQSYVNDVNLINVGGNSTSVTAGLVVSSDATGSGPYSNLNVLTASGNNDLPACIQLNAQTRGVRGVTCIGSVHTAPTAGCSSSGNLAAIYVTAGNNSLDDIHIESFCDGIQISSPSSTALTRNVVISNLVTAQKGGKNSGCQKYPPTENSVHICGSNPNNSQFGQCSTENPVSDVSVFQVSSTAGSGNGPIASIDDDVTSTVISPPTSGGSVGMYLLGEGGSGGYSRLSTSPSPSGGTTGYSSRVPTWGVGKSQASGSCTTPGTLYSNTGSGNTFYVCTMGSAWAAIPTH